MLSPTSSKFRTGKNDDDDDDEEEEEEGELFVTLHARGRLIAILHFCVVKGVACVNNM